MVRQRRHAARHAPKRTAAKGGIKGATQPEAAFQWVTWGLFVTGIVAATWYWIYWVPAPLTREAPVNVFSEERALEHVRVLSDEIGFRQVSTPGLQEAAEYLQRECQFLADLANRRPDLEATVDVERVSGAIVDRIFKHRLINVYRHLTNLILFVSPKDAKDKPAVLINAHYDSALGSPGAADCGSCVGVGLEVVRTLIQRGDRLPCPILLLLNGGEETLLQAAHGFMTQSAWRDRVGTFINLESTGSGGAPILFQYTGSWTLQAYSSSTPFPKAIVLAQEFFESGVIPADTDFRMFSSAHHGKYPGVDIATVLDATSYHTDRDTLSRIKPGSTQEYGESVVALAQKMMEMLETHSNDTSGAKWVYFDAMHSFMIRYSIETAKWIHGLPFLLLSISFLLVTKKGRFLETAVLWLPQLILSLILALILPALFGAMRALLSGRPMTWFSHHSAAFAFYWTASLTGFLLPAGRRLGHSLVTAAQFAGISLMTGTLAWTLTFANIGSSIIPFVMSLSTSIASLVVISRQTVDLEFLLALLSFTSCSCASLLLVMIRHVMEKIGMAGGSRSALGFLIPDAIVGGLNGFLVLCVLLPISPLLIFQLKPRRKRQLLKSLLTACLAVGIASSFLFPYSLRNPKRVFLNHLCRQQSDGSCNAVWSVAAWDVTPIHSALPDVLKGQTPTPTDALDWAAITPFNRIARDTAFEAPPFSQEGPWGDSYPCLELVKESHDTGTRTRRLDFALKWEKPGWGAMNITGSIRNWSIADSSGIQEHHNIIRFSQDADDPVWSFWIDVEEDSLLIVEIGIYYPTPSEQVTSLAKQFPSWTAVVAGTSFVSRLSFPPASSSQM